jgi:hypothetical protein
MTGVSEGRHFEVECPHCGKAFSGRRIDGGRADRYRGFKCPHCKLFVPLQRVTDPGLSRDPDAPS